MLPTDEIVNEARRVYGVLHQHGEMNQTLDFLRSKNLRGFVEVGSANGASFHCWASVISEGVKVSVDMNLGFGMGQSNDFPEWYIAEQGMGDFDWNPSLAEMDFSVPNEGNCQAVGIRNNNWRRRFSDVRTVEGNCLSLNTVEKLRTVLDGTLVDWVFIDAWHNFYAMITDFNNYNQFLTPTGYMGFHDIYQTKSTTQFWELIKKTFPNTIEFTEGTGIGVLPAESITSTGIHKLPFSI
jgi:hypothetical protein